ncbi:DUF6226 family protein [Streptomyces sp. JJ38]|uniref:DUF6226 family protein n=1 Tax=Streptomyces sp. JJ38 TaxID=2738128 RepID=UPI001C56A103|nr:DUF6226 family protein [Streptomyces sp. JJ38]MBW1597885.1 hypothetical protein [Streptomyces sp. JJ38]
MSAYVRPRLSLPVFRDASGAVIEYGNRWGDDEPPADSYSVDAHPERFAPLHTVAAALIDYLVDAYDVRLGHDPAPVADLVSELDEPPVRVATLTPNSCEDGAPLAFVFTAYPSVMVRAGVLHDFSHPVCGCDACDEDVEEEAEELEWRVLAVAEGRFREHYRRGASCPIGHAFAGPDGTESESGSASAEGYPKARLTEARKRLKALPNGWATWPRRANQDG